YTTEASAVAFTQSYQVFQRAALAQEPTYRVRGILTDGFDSTTKSLRALFPGARLGNCLRHALNTLPKKLVAITSPVRRALRAQFHTLWYRARQQKGLRGFALGQRLRHSLNLSEFVVGGRRQDMQAYASLKLPSFHEIGSQTASRCAAPQP